MHLYLRFKGIFAIYIEMSKLFVQRKRKGSSFFPTAAGAAVLTLSSFGLSTARRCLYAKKVATIDGCQRDR